MIGLFNFTSTNSQAQDLNPPTSTTMVSSALKSSSRQITPQESWSRSIRLMETYFERRTTNWTSSSWGTSKEKRGGFRQICMETEAQIEEEKRDTTSDLILVKEFHRHSILWTTNKIIFYTDDVPIHEMVRNQAMGGDFPSKPMGLYATTWDDSDWATSGGMYRANYKYAPFVAEFTDLVLQGCTSDPLEEVIDTGCADQKDSQLGNADFANITPKQRLSMKRFRSKYVYYSYCYDILRYPVAPPECDVDPPERRRYKDNGRLKFDKFHRRNYKRRVELLKAKRYDQNEDDQG
ncbi:putative xyloglucan endotransglucosylase/hydrolase protein 30 isoform X2 [Primulina tabacum]|uniref:putative xyloglucan endotransglucosylase/hydrolase protein 30 isoform X2 n=1 Tax=Primulina tabacum TaxID=48773 RepID=UPI003F5935CB